ncbi:MAG: hypothetical protein ACK5LM_03670, partial [Lactovum sp.]
MYRFFYRLLASLSVIAVISFSLFVILKEHTYMYSESRGEIVVIKARLDIEKDIEEIALEHDVLIAKQIIKRTTDGKTDGQISFQRFGEGEFPDNWIEEKSQEIIKRSSDNVLYFILTDGLSSQELIDILNDKEGNKAVISKTSWLFVILGTLFQTPSIPLGLFLILLALSSLIFAEKVSLLKQSGVERLSGLSNKRIAFKGVKNIFIFNSSFALLLSFVAYVYLVFNDLSDLTYLFYILKSAVIWLLFLTLNNLFSTFLVYLVLKGQAIHQAIKGYVPVKLLSFLILFVQLLSIIGLVFSLSSILNSRAQINELEKAEIEWQKNPDWFSPSLLADFGFGDFDQENLYNFFKEAQEKETVMIAVDNLNYSQDEALFPTHPYDVSNYLYVSPNLLVEQGIKSELTGTKMSKDTVWILIPESHASEQEALVEAWTPNLISNSDEEGYQIEDLELTVQSALYDDTDPIFSYRILGGLNQNNRVYSSSPVLLVLTPDSWAEKTNSASYFTAWISQQQLIFSDPELTTELIEKYHLDNVGSYNNGLYEVQSEIIKQQTSQIYLTLSALTAMATSLLLLSILNSIYFYQ